MQSGARPFQIALLLYPGVTALDAVGPWEVFSRMPNAEVRFVGKDVGGAILLGVTHGVNETPSLDLVLVPGGTTTPGQMLVSCTLRSQSSTSSSTLRVAPAPYDAARRDSRRTGTQG
jgi:putative intracellular protease/amidase